MRYELPGSLSPQEVAMRITFADWVVLKDWEDLVPDRRERVRIQKRLRDSDALVTNGNRDRYDWGYPPPWRMDGNLPGSAVNE
jgi:hypothetical protein